MTVIKLPNGISIESWMSELDLCIHEAYDSVKDAKYRVTGTTKTVEEFEKDKKGDCLDVVNYVYHTFDFKGKSGKQVKPKCYYMNYRFYDQDWGGGHAFLVFFDQILLDNWGYGLKQFNSFDDILIYMNREIHPFYPDQFLDGFYEYIPPNKKMSWENFVKFIQKKGIRRSHVEYQPPYNAHKLHTVSGKRTVKRLEKDDCHDWRMKTGIELIHREPTKEELERIWANWVMMDKNQKAISDKKSLELFGKTNKENYDALRKEY
jgi:hypothetical protein